MTDELLTVYKDGETFAMTPQELTDDLTYCSYRHNRERAPEITPEDWQTIYGWRTSTLEARLQAELAKEAGNDRETFCA